MSDTISRQAAIDALWKALYEYEDKTEKQFIDSEELDVADWIQHRNFVQNMSDIDRQTILSLPSAQPRMKGKWLREKYTDGGWYYRCSNCNTEPLRDKWTKHEVLSDYCPWCGADMRGEQDG